MAALVLVAVPLQVVEFVEVDKINSHYYSSKSEGYEP